MDDHLSAALVCAFRQRPVSNFDIQRKCIADANLVNKNPQGQTLYADVQGSFRRSLAMLVDAPRTASAGGSPFEAGINPEDVVQHLTHPNSGLRDFIEYAQRPEDLAAAVMVAHKEHLPPEERDNVSPDVH